MADAEESVVYRSLSCFAYEWGGKNKLDGIPAASVILFAYSWEIQYLIGVFMLPKASGLWGFV